MGVTQATTDRNISPTELQQTEKRLDEACDLTFFSITDEDMADLGVSSLPSPPNTQSSPPPTYSIIFDNLDFFIRTHHQSLTRANTSLHWIHHVAVEDRVPIYQLSRDKPVHSVMDYDIGKSLPGPDIQAHLRLEFIILGSRIFTQYLSAFQPLSSVVIKHIPHQYSAEMTEPSIHASLDKNTVLKYIKCVTYKNI